MSTVRQLRRFGACLWGQAATAGVVRGGSWNNNQRNARCAYRNRNIPDNFNNNLGFRLVVSIALAVGRQIPSFMDAGRCQHMRASPA
ncbi:MAG: SUMF1/EgtB/PvdO family nonheme iron enzyme [Chloroflexi bacterium]|nr:SUMF1/EgtB/PvdO family nonheme iron enzyme [Chloroflexota bacterium]